MNVRWITVMPAALMASGPGLAEAYVGPGAGFAVVSSFLMIFLAGLTVFSVLVVWPVRRVMLSLRRKRSRQRRQAGRVIVVGLDGFDPSLAHGYMKKGLLPNFKALKENGTFRPLRTTVPSISPAAWATFSTGVNPGKHRIFDFYTRDPRNYLPVLSSTRIVSRIKRLGPFSMRRQVYEPLRKSTSFWRLLGQSGIFCSVLRVPISFPPEAFYGTQLSAMCTPDLKGTQGAFTYFTSEKQSFSVSTEGVDAKIVEVSLNGDRFEAELEGPVVSSGRGAPKRLSLSIDGRINRGEKQVTLTIGGRTVRLRPGEYSDWIPLSFPLGLIKKVKGIARFMLTEIDPHLGLYVCPIQVDPEKPAFPVSYPPVYSVSLAKLHGSFATLGLSEDTWALNERVIDEKAFLTQAYDIFEERKTLLFDAMKKNRDGMIACVFDTTDRIQHMFFRYLDQNHPANRGKDTEQHAGAVEDLYRRMDALVGEVCSRLKPEDVLMVISDHGFAQFQWGVNLNTWLHREGYLVLKEGAPLGGLWLKDVDWSRTKAYAHGLAGIFINLAGRERQGIVKRGEERERLQAELREKLESLRDENNERNPIRRILAAREHLSGPYVDDAPDLIVGYSRGYRVSWNSAVGKITDAVIEENTKGWSGDHSIDPILVPGVFFSNRRFEDRRPAMEDLAPTILSLYGLARPPHQDGKILSLSPVS